MKRYQIIENLSLQWYRGESVAIVGETGCGKSTLASLIAGLQIPKRGTVRIYGRDIQVMTNRELREEVGIVFQDGLLMRGTIKENIAMGLVDVENRIIEAAVLAGIHQHIETLPNGYDSAVGSMGGNLSSGQRQRIALARAILRNPGLR